MDSRRFERLMRLFRDTSALPDEQHAEFLAGECADDPSLAREVLELLEFRQDQAGEASG